MNKKQKFLKDLVEKSLIIVMVGGRGAGKSCSSMAFADIVHKNSKRKIKIFKFPKPSVLPGFIKNITSVDEVKKGDFIIFEEAGIEFDQFSFRKEQTRELVNLMKVARHKDASCLLISQNTKTLSLDIRRLVDSWILKRPTLQQLYEESSLVKKLYDKCLPYFKNAKEPKAICYVIHEMDEFKMEIGIPPFWSNKISKAFDGEEDEKEEEPKSLWDKFLQKMGEPGLIINPKK